MDVLALAPHTVEECRRALHQGNLNASVHLFVPVFPIDLETPACKDKLCWESSNVTQKSFVLQGLFQTHRQASASASFNHTFLCMPGSTVSHDLATQWVGCLSVHTDELILLADVVTVLHCRRNYNGLFESILHHVGLMQHTGFVLRLIGRGEVVIPPGLHGKVVKEPDLAYPVSCHITLPNMN